MTKLTSLKTKALEFALEVSGLPRQFIDGIVKEAIRRFSAASDPPRALTQGPLQGPPRGGPSRGGPSGGGRSGGEPSGSGIPQGGAASQ